VVDPRAFVLKPHSLSQSRNSRNLIEFGSGLTLSQPRLHLSMECESVVLCVTSNLMQSLANARTTGPEAENPHLNDRLLHHWIARPQMRLQWLWRWWEWLRDTPGLHMDVGPKRSERSRRNCVQLPPFARFSNFNSQVLPI
jgi:hypothetical protein